jgi:aryl-alcohol dehydrogenase-like predicted oxidoreductase
VERAAEEFGINYFYWVSRKPGMGTALRQMAKTRREEIVIAVQSYDHGGLFLDRSVRVLSAVERLRDSQRVRFVGVTSHNRPFLGEMARRNDAPFDVLQVRYNAAHRGAESEVFRGLSADRPGISTYTATRWGKLLKGKHMPPGHEPMTAAECYRFALSNPSVDLCLAGPRTEEEMIQGLEALAQGPLEPEEMERARRIGDYVHG